MEFLLDALLDALTLTYFDRASCAQHDFWHQARKLRKSTPSRKIVVTPRSWTPKS